jgi:hypothetical protein
MTDDRTRERGGGLTQYVGLGKGDRAGGKGKRSARSVGPERGREEWAEGLKCGFCFSFSKNLK